MYGEANVFVVDLSFEVSVECKKMLSPENKKRTQYKQFLSQILERYKPLLRFFLREVF